MVQLMPVRAEDQVVERPERDLEMRMPDKIHHQDVAHDVDVDAEDGELNQVERDQRPDAEADPGNDAVPGTVHQLVQRMHAILGDAHHHLGGMMDLMQLPQDRIAMLRDVVEIVGDVVGQQHRDGEDHGGDRAGGTRNQRRIDLEDRRQELVGRVAHCDDESDPGRQHQERHDRLARHPEQQVGLGRGVGDDFVGEDEVEEFAEALLLGGAPIGDESADQRRQQQQARRQQARRRNLVEDLANEFDHSLEPSANERRTKSRPESGHAVRGFVKTSDCREAGPSTTGAPALHLKTLNIRQGDEGS